MAHGPDARAMGARKRQADDLAGAFDTRASFID
jgi:hypothetical protein